MQNRVIALNKNYILVVLDMIIVEFVFVISNN